MQPLQDLLNRITWDPEFGKDRFAIGYEDRLMSQEMVVPFAAVRLDPERPGMLSIQQEDGEEPEADAWKHKGVIRLPGGVHTSVERHRGEWTAAGEETTSGGCLTAARLDVCVLANNHVLETMGAQGCSRR